MKIHIEFIEPKRPRVREMVMAVAIVGLTLVVLVLLFKDQFNY
jgi:hypothetical protein